MTDAAPEVGLTLLAAGTAARRTSARDVGMGLMDVLDWEVLLRRLAARRLLAQLGPRIVTMAEGRAPARFIAAVEEAVRRTRRQAVLLAHVSAHLGGALAQAQIPALSIKGAPLGEALYGDPGCRPASDVDLLVNPEQLAAAARVIRSGGYGPPRGQLGSDGLPLLHLLFVHERRALPPVELHWRVHWYERRFACDMLARSLPIAAGCRQARPLDELVSLLLFYARDGFVDLRLATDLGAWWDALGSDLGEGAMAPVLDRYPCLARALLAALAVSERVVGLPASWLLGSRRARGARTRLAVALANPDAHGSSEQIQADVGLVDWLLTPRRGQRAFIRRQLLPAYAVLAERARARGEARPTRVGHGARVLARYALALAGLLAHLARHAHSSPFSLPRSTSAISP